MPHLLPVLVLFWSLIAFAQGASTIAPAKIFEAIGVKDGMTVCEIGAGSGELSIAVAKLVGESGRVLTSELGDERVKALQDNIKKSGVAHITVVAGDAARTNFPAAACDALFMRNVYHHFADPAAMNASIAASLKPGARYAVVDFTAPPGGEAKNPADRGKDGSHGVGPEAVSRELKQAGFETVNADTSGERWFMVVVSKPKTGFRVPGSGFGVPGSMF
jgi:predicted methyltransferase